MIDPAGQQFIDRSVKALCRRVPQALLQLLGVNPFVELAWEDVNINLPEHRADQVLILGGPDDPRRWAIHLEYQLEPDPRLLRSWRLKNAALSEQLGMDVLLVVIYLSPSIAPFRPSTASAAVSFRPASNSAPSSYGSTPPASGAVNWRRLLPC